MTYTLEDYLVGLHTGQWFGWSDSKNKVYANLVIHSDDAKPTEQECTDGVVELQAEYDSQAYARSRALEYPPAEDYLDGIVKGDQAQVDKYIADCQAVKDKYPKE
jgi:hypothetical protein